LQKLALPAVLLAALLGAWNVALAQDAPPAEAAPTTQPVAEAAEEIAAEATEMTGIPVGPPEVEVPSVAGKASQEEGGFVMPPRIWWIAPIAAIIALIFAFKFYKEVAAANPGDEKMIEIAKHVSDGAMAYLKRQYKVVAVFFLLMSGLLFWMGQIGVQHEIVFIAFLTGGGFSALCGWIGMKTATLASNRTTQGAKEGLNRGLVVAFRAGAVMGLVVVGFGLLDICLWFLGLNLFTDMGLVEITVVMLTFGMGASSQALFARVGGGIYTKAADVGADLVGKVEAGIPEDDPRNPATIADNVGDNVGDVAGMGADLYESYCGSILATAALGVSAAVAMGAADMAVNLLAAPMVIAGIGILLSSLGVYMVRTKEGATMKQLMNALNLGVYGSSVLILIVALGVCWMLLAPIEGVQWFGVWMAILIGMIAGLLIGKATELYTSYDFKPTRSVAENAETGPATVIISGIAEGMKSTWMSLLVVIVAITLAYTFAGGAESMLMGLYGVGIAAVGMLATLGITLATDAYGPIADNAGGNAEMTGQEPEVRERTDALDSLGNTTAAVGKGFAIGSAALTALALLAAYVEEVRIGQVRHAEQVIIAAVPDAIEKDGVGVGRLYNIDGKMFAIKHSVGTKESSFTGLMALSEVPADLPVGELKHARIEQVDEEGDSTMLALDGTSEVDVMNHSNDHVLAVDLDGDGKRDAHFVASQVASLRQYMDYYGTHLMNPRVLCGIFAGVLLVFLFSAMTMKAVGRAAMAMVREVRRQFKDIPGIMEGKATPEYAKCVAISTAGAQKEMIIPSLLAIIVPIAVGLVLGVSGVIGLLAGGLACGFAMAIFMANAGGAWDNAKKYIETGSHGGKGSEAHKAAVVGDTVGDPFKDTSGPSLNILIKLMSLVSVVFAGLVVKYAPMISAWIGLD
jgi:inorganic pyrophosphatase/K(+)-stimulated pyrophosphate-energized sodium pump